MHDSHNLQYPSLSSIKPPLPPSPFYLSPLEPNDRLPHEIALEKTSTSSPSSKKSCINFNFLPRSFTSFSDCASLRTHPVYFSLGGFNIYRMTESHHLHLHPPSQPATKYHDKPAKRRPASSCHTNPRSPKFGIPNTSKDLSVSFPSQKWFETPINLLTHANHAPRWGCKSQSPPINPEMQIPISQPQSPPEEKKKSQSQLESLDVNLNHHHISPYS